MATVSFELGQENYNVFVHVVEQSRNFPFAKYPVKFVHNTNSKPNDTWRAYHALANNGLIIMERLNDPELDNVYDVEDGEVLYCVRLTDAGSFVSYNIVTK